MGVEEGAVAAEDLVHSSTTTVVETARWRDEPSATGVEDVSQSPRGGGELNRLVPSTVPLAEVTPQHRGTLREGFREKKQALRIDGIVLANVEMDFQGAMLPATVGEMRGRSGRSVV